MTWWLTKAQFNEIVRIAKAQGAGKIKGTPTAYNGQAATSRVHDSRFKVPSSIDVEEIPNFEF